MLMNRLTEDKGLPIEPRKQFDKELISGHEDAYKRCVRCCKAQRL